MIPFSGTTEGALSTSRAAADSVRSTATVQRERVFDHINENRYMGRTDEEIIENLGIRHNAVHPRRWELMNAGRIHDSGRKRETSSGCLAVVWTATEFTSEEALRLSNERNIARRIKRNRQSGEDE